MNEKTKSILAYPFGFIGGIVVLLMKDSEKNTRIHGAQAIIISIGYFIISVVYGFMPITIPFFYTLLRGAFAIFTILGIVRAYNEQEPELPIVGDIAKNVFKKQIEEAAETVKEEEKAEEAKPEDKAE